MKLCTEHGAVEQWTTTKDDDSLPPRRAKDEAAADRHKKFQENTPNRGGSRGRHLLELLSITGLRLHLQVQGFIDESKTVEKVTTTLCAVLHKIRTLPTSMTTENLPSVFPSRHVLSLIHI